MLSRSILIYFDIAFVPLVCQIQMLQKDVLEIFTRFIFAFSFNKSYALFVTVFYTFLGEKKGI